jgi:hypothetical protein
MIVTILTVSLFLSAQQIIETCSEGEKLMTTHEFLDVKRKNKVRQCSLLTQVLYFCPDPTL